MIELAFLAIFSRLMTWGLGPIIATRTVAADCDLVRALLSDPANQARLATNRPDVVAPKRGEQRCDVPFRLPLGVTLQVKAPTRRVLKTEVQLRGRTVAWVTWILAAGRATTEVDLALQLKSRSLASRLVVLFGARAIVRRLDAALAALATASAHAAEDLLAVPAAPIVPAAPVVATRARGTRAFASHVDRVALHR